MVAGKSITIDELRWALLDSNNFLPWVKTARQLDYYRCEMNSQIHKEQIDLLRKGLKPPEALYQ